ncbi:MAG: hypothetical protein HQK61_09000, partial [Desulfamplus sp.]|nr:hypothetical protein [Desulfamplus sp.]
EYYSRFASDINSLAKKHKSRITYIILPILMKDFPGADQVDQKLKEISRKEGVRYYNLIDQMHDRHFFYDHMHFNNKGVAHFTKTYLEEIIK